MQNRVYNMETDTAVCIKQCADFVPEATLRFLMGQTSNLARIKEMWNCNRKTRMERDIWEDDIEKMS